MNTIHSNSHSSNSIDETPTARDLLHKIDTLRELKKKFLPIQHKIKQPEESVSGISTSEAVLKLQGFSLKDKIRSAANLSDNLRIWLISGNKKAIKRAIQTKQLCPTTTFGTEHTALELALISGQKEIFKLLFDQFINTGLVPTEKLATKMLPLCFQHDQLDAAMYFLKKLGYDINKMYYSSLSEEARIKLSLQNWMKCNISNSFN